MGTLSMKRAVTIDRWVRNGIGGARQMGVWARAAAVVMLATALGGCTPDAADAGSGVEAGADAIVVRDVAGREVTLAAPAERVLLGEGRQLIALSLVHPDPGSIIAGWLGDLRALDPASYQLYLNHSPAIAEIPQVGQTSEETFSVERALSVRPDIAILSGGHGPSSSSSETVRQLEAAGIPVVFIDFREEPLRNTVPSVRVIGQVLGREAQAEAFIDFYEQRLERIATRIAGGPIERPKVFMEMHAGGERECCGSPGRGNLGDYIDFVGGENIGASVLPGALGTLNLEYIIAQDPEIYIGTGGSNPASGVVIGSGVDPETTRESLARVVARPGIEGLSAVRNGRAHALWHNFYNTPVNVLAIEALAKWIHPDLFEDIDPGSTLEELNSGFLAVPLEGTYWGGGQAGDVGQ